MTRKWRISPRVSRPFWTCCASKAPNATIIATAIFPRNDNMAVMPTIDKINRNLATLADGQKIRYLNINAKLADRDGKLFDGMMNADKLHPAIPATRSGRMR